MSEESRRLELKSKRICRFCMTQDEPLTNIYSKENRLKSSAPFPLQIMSCVSIEVFSNDGMPGTACDDCRMFMEYCYRFKQMCKKSDNALRQYPLTGTWPQPLEIPKLCEELIFKMYPNLNQKQKTINASFQNERGDKKTPPIKTHNQSITVIDINNSSLASSSSSSSAYHQQSQNQQKKSPRLLNKNSVKILNKDAQKYIEPILSQPIIKTDSDGNVEIITEILEQGHDEQEIDPIKDAAPVETNVFPCSHCERSFPLRQLLDIHMVNHNRERNFQCNLCTKSFFSKYDLGKHMLIHTGEKPFECVVCKKAFTRSTLLHRHEKIHTDQPKFLCVYCEKPFLSKEEMDKHTERHKKSRKFVCKICNKAFAFKQGLERHETVHAKDQPYPCQYCDYSFPTPSKLARHLTAHAGERPFPCKLCPKSYLLSHHLTRHLRSHKQNSGESSYKCFDCEKVFTTRDDLIYHSAVHATETLICPLCKEDFDNLDCVTEHIKSHAEGEQFACEFCDLIFMTAEKLQIHSDIEHAGDLAAYQEHDAAVADKMKTNQNLSNNSQDEEIIEEFIIEEYYEDDSQQEQEKLVVEEQTVKEEENEILFTDDAIITALPNRNLNERGKQQQQIKNTSEDMTKQKSKFMQEFEEYNDEIAMEIETLTKHGEYIIHNESPPQKIRKLNPKEHQKVIVMKSEVPTPKETASKSSSSQIEVRKSVEERKQQQQITKPEIDTKSKQSTVISSVLKQLPKSVTVTKREIPTESTSLSQELSAKKAIRTSPSNKEEAKKIVATTSSTLKEKITKQSEALKVKTQKNLSKQESNNSSKTSPDTRNRSTSETREKPISNTNSKNQGETSSTSQHRKSKLVEMVIGDRKVTVQKVTMTKQQVDLMSREGKIEVKDGLMIYKNKDLNKSKNNSSDNNSNSKMVTRSKQQRSTTTSSSNIK